MVTYKTVKKCIKSGCNNMFEGPGAFCEEHNKVKSNNPKGYNKHKKNTEVSKTKLQFETDIITQETVKQAYRDLWKAKRELLSKAQRFARINKLFCGLDQVDEELKQVSYDN